MAKQSLRARLGDPPSDDSLAAISWMQRALAVLAADVIASNLPAAQKRDEMLKIADRMAKLRDPDRIYQAERALRGARDRQDEPTPGPQLRDVSQLVLYGSAGTITARRGRPPKRSLS